MFALLLSATMFAQEAKIPFSFLEPAVQNPDIKPIPQNSGAKAVYPPIFFEEFEGTFPPAGWTRYGTNFLYNATDGRTNPGCFWYPEGTPSPYATYGITTPQFAAVAGAYFSFWTINGVNYTASSSYYQSYRIKVSTTTNAQSAFTTIKEYATFAYSGIHANNVIVPLLFDWYEMRADLSAYAGQNIYVAIEVYDHYGNDEVIIDDVGAFVLSDNDLSINASYLVRQIPVTQTFVRNLSAKVTNEGSQTQNNAVVTAKINGTNFGATTTIPSIAKGAAVNVNFNTNSDFPVVLGPNTITYSVQQTGTDDVPDNNTLNQQITGTANLLAHDDGTHAGYALGSGTSLTSVGNVFTFTKMTKLSQLDVYMANWGTAAGAASFYVRIYAMNGANLATTEMWQSPAIPRTTTIGWQGTVTVPMTAAPTLIPGNYFICITQIGTASMGVVGDGNKLSKPGMYRNSSGTFMDFQAAYALAPEAVGALEIRLTLAPNDPCTATAPTNLAVVPGYNSAVFTWDGNATTGYRVTLIKGTTETQYTTTAKTLTVNGLADGNYTWSVTAFCDDTNNPTTTGAPFAPLSCATVTLPWNYGFEDGTHNSAVIPCFSQVAVVGTNEWTVNQTFTDYNRTPRTGAKNAFLRYSNSRWLFREFYLTPGHYTFGLWARQDATSGATITLKYGTEATVAGMTNTIKAQTPVTNGNYQEFKGPFTITTAGYYFLGVYGEETSTPWYISIDDMFLEAAPCSGVTSIDATPTTSNITITWTATGAPNVGYDIYFSTTNTPPTVSTTPTASVPATQTNYTFPGLNPNTTYYIWVRTNCGAGAEGAWVAKTATTLCVTQTIPWYYGFEDTGATWNIPCLDQDYPATINNQNVWIVYEPGNTTLDATTTVYNRTPRTGNRSAYLKYSASSTVPNSRWLFREVYLTPGDYTFSVWGIQDGTTAANAYLTLKYGTVATAAGMTNTIKAQTSLTNVYQEVKGDFTITTAGNYVMGIFGEKNSGGWYLTIDDISLVKILDVDMRANTIAGPAKVIASEPQTFTVNVTNLGKNPATNYRVSVVDAVGTELGYTIGTTTLNKDQSTNVNVLVTFLEAQVPGINIKGRVDITADENLLNNETALMNVEILTECATGFGETQIGAGTSTLGTYPFNFNWGNCMAQSIYLANEINLAPGSVITEISYKYNVSTALTVPKTISVYMTNTTLTNFPATGSTSSWIPFNQFQQVYSKAVTLPVASPYELVIKLDQPFVYTGGNLCIATYKEMNTENYTAPAAFYTVQTPANRTIVYYSDGTLFNMTSPQTPSSTTSNVPNVKITINPELRNLKLNPANVGDPKIYLDPETIPGMRCGNQTAYFNAADPCKYISKVIIGGVDKGAISSFDFSYDVLGTNVLPVIEVQTAYYQYDVTAIAGPNGEVSPALQTIQCGTQATINIQPNEGYTLDSLFFNNVYIKVAATTKVWKTPAITGASNVFVKFKVCPFNINVAIVGNGIVELNADGDWVEVTSGNLGVDADVMYLFRFTANTGSELYSVLVDGVLQPSSVISHSYMFLPINANHTLKVEFKLKNMIINASAGANGKITPSGNVPVPYGNDKTFTIKANDGFVIDQLFVDGNIEAVGTEVNEKDYFFYNVTANHTIYVTFKTATMTILLPPNDPEVDGCGTMSPAGEDGVFYIPYNGTQTFYFTPCEGYKISEVIADGISYPNAVLLGSFTFTYVTHNNHTLKVKYTHIQHAIKSSISGYGTITPSGTTLVNQGDNQKYTWTVLPGYKVANVYVDGLNNPAAVAAGEYTFANVTAPHVINVVTAPLTYNIIAAAETGGHITPSGNITVGYGQNQMFTFKPATGYEIKQVLVDGVLDAEAALTGAYVFMNVKADHEILVKFNEIRYVVAAKANTGGSIEPAGITELTYFDEIVYTITPEEGYKISSVVVNGNDMGAINTFTFSEVEADGTIEVFFAPDVTIVPTHNMGISIYSNANTVYVDNKDLAPISDVTIFDMYGRVVWQGNVYNKHNTITLNVSAGIYAVRVATENGFTTTKVAIQK